MNLIVVNFVKTIQFGKGWNCTILK